MSNKKLYKVMLRGNNFLLNIDGKHAKSGLTATQIVTSEIEEHAKRTAIIRNHHDLNQSDFIVRNIPDIPKAKVEIINKISMLLFIYKQKLRSIGVNKADEAAVIPHQSC